MNETGAALIWFFLLTVAATWPMVREFATMIPGSLDAQDCIGMLWHAKEVVFGRESLFYMSHLYAPQGITTLTHSVGPLMGFMVLPFWLGGATFTYNAAIMIGVWLTGFCLYLFARSIRLPFAGSLLAGTLFLMAPVHLITIAVSHLGRAILGLIPLTLLGVFRTINSPLNRRWLRLTPFLLLLTLLLAFRLNFYDYDEFGSTWAKLV